MDSILLPHGLEGVHILRSIGKAIGWLQFGELLLWEEARADYLNYGSEMKGWKIFFHSKKLIKLNTREQNYYFSRKLELGMWT